MFIFSYMTRLAAEKLCVQLYKTVEILQIRIDCEPKKSTQL